MVIKTIRNLISWQFYSSYRNLSKNFCLSPFKMDLYSVFVTGANRGIGLGLVKHLVQLPNPPKLLFATYRLSDGTEELKNIRDKYKSTQVHLIKMDVTRGNEIASARKIVEYVVGEKGLTLLVNNAGVAADQPFPQITEENLLYHFKTNTIGPVMVAQEFYPLLQKAANQHGLDSKMAVSKAAILNISSALGSIGNSEYYFNLGARHCPSYNISKAGLNMSMRVIASELKKHDILVVMMCPGWVKTDMGTERAELTVDESASAILQTLAQLHEGHHGKFMDRNGNLYQF